MLKWKSIKPYVIQVVITSVLYFGIPIVLFATDIVQIPTNNQHGNIGTLLVFPGIIYYFVYITLYFIPDLAAVFDLLTNNFVIDKLAYIESRIDKRYEFIDSKKLVDGQVVLYTYCIHNVIMAGNSGKSTYRTSHYYILKTGTHYTVQYGKHSKVIVSILSSQGEEMLQFDVR